MRKKANGGNILIGTIGVILLIVFVIMFTPFENPIRDYFADTVNETTVVYVNSTEFIEIIEYINSTEWVNTTEYVPYWYNQTFWYNNTLWYNDTIWINSTEWINITEYYPFVPGWNVSSDVHYIRFYKQSSQQSPYRFSFYNILTSSVTSTDYASYASTLSALNTYKSNGAMTKQQYDCGIIQLFILVGT